jgi:hypothetical protein
MSARAHESVLSGEATAREAAERRRTAAAGVDRRIRDQLLRTGERLDEMVQQRLVADTRALQRQQQLDVVHRRMLAQKNHDDRARSEMELRIQEKNTRILRVRASLEYKKQVIAANAMERAERERAAREALEEERAARTAAVQERLLFDSLSRNMVRTVERELAERQRHEREVQRMRQREDAELLRGAIAQRQQSQFKRVQSAERARQHDAEALDAQRRRHDQARVLAKLADAGRTQVARQEAERTQRVTARKLIEASRVLSVPVVFNKAPPVAVSAARSTMRADAATAGASASVARSASRRHHVDPTMTMRRVLEAQGATADGPRVRAAPLSSVPPPTPFVMSGDRVTSPHVVTDRVWRGVLSTVHQQAAASLADDASPIRGASASRRLDSRSPMTTLSPRTLMDAL